MIRNKARAVSKHQPGPSPQFADLLTAGVAQYQAGHLEQVRETCRFVLSIDSKQADALHLLGVSFLWDQPSEAEALIRQAISHNSRNPLFHSNLGLALRQQGRFDDALTMYDKALRLKPDYLDAHLNRGLTLLSLQRQDEAAAAFGAALRLKADFVPALRYRANTSIDLRRFEAAVADYDRLLAMAPDDVGALNNRGLALLELKRFERALASFDEALAIAPDIAEAVNGRGCALRAMGQLDQALACFVRAAALKPDYVEPLVNSGTTLQDLGRFNEALARYTAAQHLRRDHAAAHWNEATLRLLTGDLIRGFAKAEWRLKLPALGLAAPKFEKPLWLGDTPLEGKTILVHADLGLGDTIHFARYIPLLAARGARVIALVQPSLRRLIGTVEGISLCINDRATLPDFDVHCPLSSLPLAFGTTLDSIPAQAPYLRAPALSQSWRDRLGASDTPKIGVVWSGNAQHLNDRNRSIGFDMLQPLFACGATFYGLQTELRAEDEAAARAQGRLVLAGRSFTDFADTAALISALDLVITVDTSAAHLAGALGRPLWILLPFVPDWRWLLRREDSPWYPTARLFRQEADRLWEPVIDRVKHALSESVLARQLTM